MCFMFEREKFISYISTFPSLALLSFYRSSTQRMLLFHCGRVKLRKVSGISFIQCTSLETGLRKSRAPVPKVFLR